MKSQNDKSHLSMFGEFSVAAELNRRRIVASVTYGNQKSMDIIALSPDGHYAVIEVKTIQGKRFPTGLTKDKQEIINDNVFWVFVTTELENDHPATNYYVLSDREIKQIQGSADAEYMRKYKSKHGTEFSGKGVPSLAVSDLANHKDAWYKIENFINSTREKVFSGSTSSIGLSGEFIQRIQQNIDNKGVE